MKIVKNLKMIKTNGKMNSKWIQMKQGKQAIHERGIQ